VIDINICGIMIKVNPILLVFLIVVSLITIVSTVYSDGGFLIIRRSDYITFDAVDRQDAIIFYTQNYQYLLVFSKYKVINGSESNIAIYYFPLPSKPIYFNISILNISRIEGIILTTQEYIKYELYGMHTFSYFPFIAFAGAGAGIGGGSRFIELATITSKFFDVSLIETSEPDENVFLNILRSKGYQGDLPKELVDIINYYRDKGWKYFAIGVLRMPGEITLVQQFIFKTDNIVFPLYVERVNTGISRVKLVIVSSHPLKDMVNHIGLRENSQRYFRGLDLEVSISVSKEYMDQLYEFFYGSYIKIVEKEPSINELFKIVYFENGLKLRFKGYVYAYEVSIPLKYVESDIEFKQGGLATLIYTVLGSPVYLFPHHMPPIWLLLLITSIALAIYLNADVEKTANTPKNIHGALLIFLIGFTILTVLETIIIVSLIILITGLTSLGIIIFCAKLLLIIPFLATYWFTRRVSEENVVRLNKILVEYVSITIIILALTTYLFLIYFTYIAIAGSTLYYYLAMRENIKILDLDDNSKKMLMRGIGKLTGNVIILNIAPYIFLLLLEFNVI